MFPLDFTSTLSLIQNCKSTLGDLYHRLTGRQKLRQIIVPGKTNNVETDWTPVLMYTAITPVRRRPGEDSRSQMVSSHDIPLH